MLFALPQVDFDAVKNAFLRAQQIKAALDVGLIKVGGAAPVGTCLALGGG